MKTLRFSSQYKKDAKRYRNLRLGSHSELFK